MTRRERLSLHEQTSAKVPDEVPGEDREGRPENIFVLLAGGIYGAILGVCFRGEFGMALLCAALVVACICLGWWMRGMR